MFYNTLLIGQYLLSYLVTIMHPSSIQVFYSHQVGKIEWIWLLQDFAQMRSAIFLIDKFKNLTECSALHDRAN